MTIKETPLPGLFIFEPRVFEDSRGYFFESYNKNGLSAINPNIGFVQDNQSKSAYGVIRGLHFQRNPKAQSKLVRVLSGTIYDVAVDCRIGSPTFGKHFGCELSEDNKKQLFIPKGFAHGFSVLSETAIVFYKCDEYYSPETDGGIFYNDETLGIDWRIPTDKVILSEKDSKLPFFSQAELNFKY
ncbi:MAG: dTDP-4-dehydrorhamnose 3,5-epimerase [Bacteroidales bacterium]|nr:dTDP-4-dehydrorhamnose 3,5-epimerase [Bacteroidales bacterium]